MLNKITKFIGPKVGHTSLAIKSRAPELLLGGGIITGVASVVMIAKAHKKSDEVFGDIAEDIMDVQIYVGNTNAETNDDADAKLGDYVTHTDERKMLLPIYANGARRAARLYGPGLMMGAASLFLLLASHGTLKRRNKALLSTIGVVSQGFAIYRQRVVAEQGTEADERFYYGAEARKITTLEIDADGKKKKTKSTKNHIPDEVSPIMYQRLFDHTMPMWNADPDMNEFFLQITQQHFDDWLKIKGYVLLNEVYTALGFDESPEGAVVGWSTNVPGDNYVSFGLDNDINKREGDNRWLLDFNVNGVVFDTIGEG
ncbi:hypothetical protein KAR91_10110 [Candidatus Pacearchaeota archaeon]|nr:hypothetical protein [Candidatus Pacearchaeota archaeon]